MDERDYKAMNDELKSAEELANNWADEYYERESERTSIIMEKDEWLNRRYNFLTGYNRCKEDFKKQLKEKEQESIMLEKMCNRAQDHAEQLLKQLTKSNEMAERLAEELEYWDEFNDVLTEYKNSKK